MAHMSYSLNCLNDCYIGDFNVDDTSIQAQGSSGGC